MQTSSSQKLLNMSHGGKILPNLTISRRIKNDQMEHKHCRRIAAVIPGCEGKHSIALLLERCSPAEYHSTKADVVGAPSTSAFLL